MFDISTLSSMWMWIYGVILVLLVIFVIWEFITMILSKKLRKVDKGIWAILFVAFSILTACVWFFVKRK